MQVPKLLLTLCAASLCASSISVFAVDTPEQAAARAALEQKMHEADGKNGMYFVPLTNDTTTGSVNMVPTTPAPKAPIGDMPPAETTGQMPSRISGTFLDVPPPSGDNPAQAAARAALEQQLKANPNDNPSQAASRAALEQALSEPMTNSLPTPDQFTSPGQLNVQRTLQMLANAQAELQRAKQAEAEAKSRTTNLTAALDQAQADIEKTTAAVVKAQANVAIAQEAVAKAQAQAQKEIEEQNAADLAEKQRLAAEAQAQAAAKAAAQAEKEKPKATPPPASKETGFKPIVAPPLPISAAQETQLQELLTRYKADMITPEEYQKQRAEILAQP